MLRTTIATPVGALAISGDGERLTRLAWAMDETPGADTADDDPLLREARRQIEAWLAGRLTRFDLPLTPAASQRGEVLRAAIVAIPYGETASYGQVARAVESGPRAIGQACARNPFPIIVPCHRVLGNGGRLGHYSGGHGLETKLALLRLESPGFQHIRN